MMRKYVLIAWISLTWLILKNIQPKSTMKMLNGMYVRLIFILFALSNPVLISYSNENMWCVILLSSHRIGIWSLGWIGGCDDSQYSLYGSRISINYSLLFMDNVTSIRAFLDLMWFRFCCIWRSNKFWLCYVNQLRRMISA